MVKIIENVTICPNCKIYMEYNKEDIQNFILEYMVYGGEYACEEYKGIICPKCGEKINIK